MAAQRPDGPDYASPYGRVTESHASVYHEHAQTTLVAVCDLREEANVRFRESWGDLYPDLRYYTDYHELFAHEKPDIVSVVTPDHRHADIVVAAANSGAKAIFCEKPIATSLADADRMISACADKGVLLSINHSRRWSPIYQEARRLLQSNELGPLRAMTVNFFSRRAMLFRNGAHMIDVLHFFADADAAWVWADLEAGFDHFDIYRGDGGVDPNREPCLDGYLHFTNGVRAHYESAKTAFSNASFTLTCEQGRLVVTDDQITIQRLGADGVIKSMPHLTLTADPQMLKRSLAELLRVLAHGGELVSSGQSARKTLAAMLAMLQSHAQGNVRVNL